MVQFWSLSIKMCRMKSLNSYCNLWWRASWITSTSHWLSAYPQWPMLTLSMVSHEELKIVHFFMWWVTLSIIIQIHKFIFYSLLLSIDLFWRVLHVFLGKQRHELRFVWWNTRWSNVFAEYSFSVFWAYLNIWLSTFRLTTVKMSLLF